MIKFKIKKGLLIAIVATQTLLLPHTAQAANEDLAKDEPANFLLVEQQKKVEVNSLAELLLKTPEESVSDLTKNNTFLSETDITLPDQPNTIPTPTAPAPTPRVLDNEEAYRARICEVFPASECQNALTIVYYESKFDPNALSPQDDRGLFQVNCYWHKNKLPNQDCQVLYDPETNIQIAYQIWSAQGWCPWSTRHRIGVYCGY